ncbi:hypothetical protein KDN32_22005 [Nocardioides sp. J2M5]|uniref:hypothetical protein n=1 Tax=Nocardioides palaemonis TaxID=2829810 RepID=UPI001BA895F4|nr:hypothetical protein [Nocardioides palaemonis]MBS2940421.1 hypothetical protein [Nocardioides palaemonis]
MTRPTVPMRVSHVVATALVVPVLLGSSSPAGATAGPVPSGQAAGRQAACPPTSTDPADFPRSVPLPRDDYTVRGYLGVDCRHLLDLAMETDDLGPVQADLVRRMRAKGFHGVTSRSRMAEVPTGPGGTEPEVREEFVVRATGRGLRVKVDLGFVGVAPRWSGTALVRYVLRPLR